MKLQAIRRDDPAQASSVFQSLLPDTASVRATAEVFCGSILVAHSAEPMSWSISLFRKKVRLNVGQVEVATLSERRLRLFIAANQPVDGGPGVTVVVGDTPAYPAVPVPSGYCDLSPRAIRNPPADVLAAHHEYVLAAASRKRRSPFRRAFSPGVVSYCEALCSRMLPRPGGVDLPDEPRIPEEALGGDRFVEGATRQIVVNAYERDPKARRACIAHYGYKCAACDMTFEARYGSDVARVIHVHHLVPLSEVKASYTVDPVADLRPVCPNCHAVLHSRQPPFTIEEVRALLHQSDSA